MQDFTLKELCRCGLMQRIVWKCGNYTGRFAVKISKKIDSEYEFIGYEKKGMTVILCVLNLNDNTICPVCKIRSNRFKSFYDMMDVGLNAPSGCNKQTTSLIVVDDKIGYEMAQILNVPDDFELVCFLPVGIAETESTLPQKRAFEERAWFNSFPNIKREF